MLRRERCWRSCGELTRKASLSAALAASVLLSGCSHEARARVGQDLPFGPYVLRVTSVEAYTRAHQGVPFEVEMRVRCEGGNRFEPMDFAEKLSRTERIHFSTAQGWRERGWLLARGDDFHDFVIHASPLVQSTGMMLEIGNPYAKVREPNSILVDLGR
jgi:hypothetical protein